MTDLPTEKQSIDKRYCQQCYEILAKEADDMKAAGNRRKPWWVPCSRQPIGQVPVMVLGQVEQTQTVSVTPENCLFCGKELMKRRKSKLFCGAVCRVRYSRQQKDTVLATLPKRSFVTSAVNDKNQPLGENFPQVDKSKPNFQIFTSPKVWGSEKGSDK